MNTKEEKEIPHTQSSRKENEKVEKIETSTPSYKQNETEDKQEDSDKLKTNTQSGEKEEVNVSEGEMSTANKPEIYEMEEDANDKSLSHTELKMFFQEALGRIIEADPVLADLHSQITLEEVNALIELEHGRAMRVYVEREGGEKAWEVVVPRDATLHQLKQNLRHHVALVLSRKGIKKRISWKYVWKSNWLSFEGERLMDDNSKLLQYGIKNKSTLKFVKRYREKQKFGKRKTY